MNTSMSGSFSRSQTFLSKVFTLMFVGLGISTLFAVLFGTNHELMSTLVTTLPNHKMSMTGLGWLVTFLPLIFVLIMSFGYDSLSKGSLMGLFLLFAAINGISLSFVVMAYTTVSLVGCFASAAAMFGVMALYGSLLLLLA